MKLSSNKGHQTAVIAGLTEVDADCYITMDADLQDDPNEIKSLIGYMAQKSDLNNSLSIYENILSSIDLKLVFLYYHNQHQK